MQKIPFFNYKKLYEENKIQYQELITDVLSRGEFIMGSDLLKFEKNLSKFLGCKHAIGVADGTAALIFSLKAAGIKQGDEVILSSHTFIATASAVKSVGAIPVICDCNEDSMMNVKSATAMINNKTKAIMPTQLNGRTCDMDEIIKISEEYNLKIIEDSCQALGAKYKNKFAGLFGVAGSFSFYPAKTLGCFGDGGAVVTNDDNIASYIRQLRDHGRDTNGKVKIWGHNGRLDNLHASILNYKLTELTKYILRRREIAKIYNELLSPLNNILLPPPPDESSLRFDVFQNYEIQLDFRDEVRNYLLENGVGTIMQWGGWMIHQFDDLILKHQCPYAEKMSKRMILLPMNHFLSDDEVVYISKLILNFFYKKGLHHG